MLETGTLVLHTAETQGSLFLASMAEGYLGEEKLKLGSVDMRAPAALLATGYGLYQTMTGQQGAGAHVLALGNGLMGSWLASAARGAGRTLAEKKAGGGAAVVPQVQPAQVSLQGLPMLSGPSLLPDPFIQGPLRTVLLTPPETATDGGDEEEVGRRGGRRRGGARRPGRGGKRGPGRFVRADQNDDEDDDN